MPEAVVRRRLTTAQEGEAAARSGGLYFTSAKEHLDFIRSGSTMLDNALGGGWVLGRLANIIGNKSTGKTLLAIESAANFAQAYPRGFIFFRERESAFDVPYAEALGLPLRRVDFGPTEGPKRFATVEGFHDDLVACIAKCKSANQPGWYILDSFDALSVDAEMNRKITDASYGGDRAKKMSEMFRRLVRPMEEANMGLMIISQIRDKVGVMFGAKTGRMGGHALDFYATHIINLSHIGNVEKTRDKVKRVVGAEIKALVDKNKVAVPKRQADFEIMFGYGIDDLVSCMDWLIEVGRIDAIGIRAAGEEATKKAAVAFLKRVNAMDDTAYRLACREVAAATKVVWREIEDGFMPRRKKY